MKIVEGIANGRSWTHSLKFRQETTSSEASFMCGRWGRGASWNRVSFSSKASRLHQVCSGYSSARIARGQPTPKSEVAEHRSLPVEFRAKTSGGVGEMPYEDLSHQSGTHVVFAFAGQHNEHFVASLKHQFRRWKDHVPATDHCDYGALAGQPK